MILHGSSVNPSYISLADFVYQPWEALRQTAATKGINGRPRHPQSQHRDRSVPSTERQRPFVSSERQRAFVSNVCPQCSIHTQAQGAVIDVHIRQAKLDIPTNLRGRLIGSGGANIQRLQQEFSVQIAVPAQNRPGPVTVSGEAMRVISCLESIEAQLQIQVPLMQPCHLWSGPQNRQPLCAA